MLSYRDCLAYAESFYLEARRETGSELSGKRRGSVIASLLFSWIAIESFINSMMEDFAALPQDMFSMHERAFLTEHTVEFVDSGAEAGEFRMSKNLQYRPLEHKILFLLAKFGKGAKVDKGRGLWQRFKAVKEKRDQITHPRKSSDVSVTLSDAEDAIEVAKAIVRTVSEKVWGRPVTL
jgi:hypothetical protein